MGMRRGRRLTSRADGFGKRAGAAPFFFFFFMEKEFLAGSQL